MVDALEPAALDAQDMIGRPLNEALETVVRAAEHGVEKTKDMVAARGKAKALGKRAIGHPDPGALSTYLILRFMAAYLKS